jgi:aryl-alcohol dehydrogenase-like predicted oxidoreductase
MRLSQDLSAKVPLGSTGILVSRLGIASSYGVSKTACLEAFDHGVNYFFWGSARTAGMASAIRELTPAHREDLCVVIQCYARRPSWISRSIRKGLDTLRLDHADVLLLGWHEKMPNERTMDAVEEERRKGTFKHLAVSSHKRSLFRDFMADCRYGVFHVRYNAANVGAEEDVFPYLPGPQGIPDSALGADLGPPSTPSSTGPGIVAFTVLRWGDLLNPKKMPAGSAPLTASDCYRFALSNPHVHVAVTGPSTDEEMGHALGVLQAGPLDGQEMERVRGIGAHVYGQKSMADWLR